MRPSPQSHARSQKTVLNHGVWRELPGGLGAEFMGTTHFLASQGEYISMAQYFILARFVAHAGHGEEVLALLRGLVSPSRAEEGCLFYDLYQDHENQNVFIILDGWRNKDAFEAHAASLHVAQTLGALSHHLQMPPVITHLDQV